MVSRSGGAPVETLAGLVIKAVDVSSIYLASAVLSLSEKLRFVGNLVACPSKLLKY